ncbi:MAG: glycosyltransferase, partial [Acidobacteriota bacterium]
MRKRWASSASRQRALGYGRLPSQRRRVESAAWRLFLLGAQAGDRALDENLGFAGGMNTAFHHIEIDYLLTLNADIRPQPDELARCIGAVISSNSRTHFGGNHAPEATLTITTCAANRKRIHRRVVLRLASTRTLVELTKSAHALRKTLTRY